MPIVEIAHVIELIAVAGIFAGTISTYCRDHPGPGCVNKRDLLQDLTAAPVMNTRADVGPCNVPKYNFDICNTQLHDQANRGIKVQTSIPSPGVGRFDNVPPACMDLAVALSGSCTGTGPRPVPCGSACMQYTGLTDDQLRQISSYLN
ncbi:8d3f5037-7f47-4a30-b24b-6ca852fca6bc [Thermothielavioides terrestris]|uniref:8d3f5037-7f47-4a30-b24b-6ca852fca6bc n=1 Tax=Thermothielavioides terrestris TaxID=2587410 RepID=A0A3S4F068_9PEZI|nr:8d3f5037-7f47-4a30-b24b-6ca852fca6bc [Thermothielavioides terrestris]